MTLNIPTTEQRRIVIIGAGFAGLRLARRLAKQDVQVVIIDRNNYHQFQPLYYQVAMAGLEPSSISFPLRKAFQKSKNVYIRVTTMLSVDPETHMISTAHGDLHYDTLVLAMGAKTNYYGNDELKQNTYALKTVNQALALRNEILINYEQALLEPDYDKRQGLIDIVVVGGGPTGVELAGALAEMKSHILPKDYHELDHLEVDIYLIQSGGHLLAGMSDRSQRRALDYLEQLGVKVLLHTRVDTYDGQYVVTDQGHEIRTDKVIWAAGITCTRIAGLPESIYTHGERIKVDASLRAQDLNDIYVLGDQACVVDSGHELSHPQVAQVAIQMADHLYRDIIGRGSGAFVYKDKGSMATVGRNKAVVDLPELSFSGFAAWVVWLVVHLMALIGVKNRIFVFLNWVYGYFTYDQSLRLIIRADKEEET